MASTETQPENAPAAISNQLLERCRTLLDSITAFEEILARRKITVVNVRRFKSAVQLESKSLERLAAADPTASKTIHSLRSSNLPFYEATWTTARASRRIVGLQKRFHWEKPGKGSKNKPKKKSVLVDIVAEDGLQWIKISTISENTLLFEKAKAGWEADEYDSSDNHGPVKKVYPEGVEPPPEAPNDEDSEDEFGRIELVRVAQDLKKASNASRMHFKHPAIVLMLPNIQEGRSKVVDGILTDLRETGAIVNCGSLPSPAVAFDPMISTFSPPMTPTLNLDCTILLALISDLSHVKPEDLVLPEKPHPSLTHQVDVEKSTPLLPDVLYPGLEGAQKFVTSRRSATRMWEIVRTIGTPTEHQRAQIFFSESKEHDSASLSLQLQTCSAYNTPEMPLPIEIVEDGITKLEGVPGSVLTAVSAELSEINKSVFLLGWTNGWTTVTSNKVAVKLIEGVVTKKLDELQARDLDDSIEAPKIWTIDIARSLVGKEGARTV